MAGLPATGVMGRITFWPVNRPVVVKGLSFSAAFFFSVMRNSLPFSC